MKRRQFLQTAAVLPLSMAISNLFAQTTAPCNGAQRTDWTINLDKENGKATLLCSVDGRTPEPFQLRGVCYSPCPINGSNSDAPGIGDWFWDTFGDGVTYEITGWEALWKRDMPNLKALGANTIRVYSMLSRQINQTDDPTKKFPKVPFSSDPNNHLFTHKTFLDMCCENGINVMVGIPLPSRMLWKELYDNPAITLQDEKNYWGAMLEETVANLAPHPAVLGFIIENEEDGNGHTYSAADFADPSKNPDPTVTFWWSQIEKMAGLAKTAMGNNKKLVGIANHDDNKIPGMAQYHMANCPSVDFWGVNSYQTENFNAIFHQTPDGPGYAGVEPGAMKPVIITEFGLPATGHAWLEGDAEVRQDEFDKGILLAEGDVDQSNTNPVTPEQIYHNQQTRQNTANVISKLIPQAFSGQFPLCLGLYYFEYSDELWNQPESLTVPNYKTYRYYGGALNPGFPNYYWDQHGFGLFSVRRGLDSNKKPVADNAPIWVPDPGWGRPTLPIDIINMTDPNLPITVRQETFNAVRDAFVAAQATAKEKS